MKNFRYFPLFLLILAFSLVACSKKFDEQLQKDMQAEYAATEAAVKTADNILAQMRAELTKPEAAKLPTEVLKSHSEKLKLHEAALKSAYQTLEKQQEIMAKHEKKEMKLEEVKLEAVQMKNDDALIMSNIKKLNSDFDVVKTSFNVKPEPIKNKKTTKRRR